MEGIWDELSLQEEAPPVGRRGVLRGNELKKISLSLLLTSLILAVVGCASTQREKPRQVDNSVVVGFVDTSVLLHRRLGSVKLRQTDPRGGLWDLAFGADGYFWGHLPSGTFRVERISVYDPSDRSSMTELDSPYDEKSFNLSVQGNAFFLGAFKLDAALEKTSTTMGSTAIIILANAITIRRVGNPTEKEALSWLLKKLGDHDQAAQDSIRKRLAQMGGPVKD